MSKVKDALAYERCPDITGLVFGRLTVIKRVENDNGGNARWLCECSCGSGKPVIVPTYTLRSGNTLSCGCYQRERASIVNRKHGASRTRLFKTWSDMKQRCDNPNDKGYKNWGARGIKVCPEWSDFENFQRWALDNGYNDHLTIDRINVDGDYDPNNCRFVTYKVQANNKRNNHLIEFNGKVQTLAQWSEELCIPIARLSRRLQRGWTVERAFTEPKVQPHGRKRSET